MRKIPLLSAALFSAGIAFSQSTYTMANFAASGDTFYLTKASANALVFDTTGANLTWNYAALTGNSQRRLVYRLPTQTGYTTAQWPYIANSNNVNLSSTDGQTTAVLGFQQSNPNDYFLKNNNLFRQKAASYTVSINGFSVNVKNVYESPDTIYKFPLQYLSNHSSSGAYTINIPGTYFRHTTINRKDTVQGWGTVMTPHASYSNALQLVCYITQVDSLSVFGQPVITNDTTYAREISWFDPSEKTPVLFVRQTKAGNNYITSSIEYADVQQYYQPAAAFAFLPAQPSTGDTVIFQNLSLNATGYKWSFADGTDSSTTINPEHIFTNAGIYPVQLIAYNGPLSDTLVINVRVNPKNQTYTFTGNGNWDNADNWSNHSIPPSPLPATNSIIIDPAGGGECILNVQQTVNNGASLTVNTGKNLVIPANLVVQ